MKMKQRAAVNQKILGLESALVKLREDTANNLATSEQLANRCAFELNQTLAEIRNEFEMDAKSPYEENANVRFENATWAVKDYVGEYIAIKKGNDVKIVKSKEVSSV